MPGDDEPQDGADARRREVEARREATRRAIVAATTTLLDNRTFGQVTVEEVMASAGLTRTAFYRYFPDLDGVVLAAMGEMRIELGVAADRWLAFDADADVGLDAATRALAEIYRRHGRLLLALSDASVGSRKVLEAWHDVVESFVEPVHRRLVDLAGPDRTRLAHPEETARALVWMTERYLLETFGRDRKVSVETAAETLRWVWGRAVLDRP